MPPRLPTPRDIEVTPGPLAETGVVPFASDRKETAFDSKDDHLAAVRVAGESEIPGAAGDDVLGIGVVREKHGPEGRMDVAESGDRVDLGIPEAAPSGRSNTLMLVRRDLAPGINGG